MRRPLFALILIALALLALAVIFLLPGMAARQYGPPSPALGAWDRIDYAIRLLWYDGMLTSPLDPSGGEVTFNVESGESITSIAVRLEESGLIQDAAAFRDYLVYTGLDTSVQAREFLLSPAMSIVDIARKLQDATPDQVTFVILPGWRMEEVAASLSISGVNISFEDFLSASGSPQRAFGFFPPGATSEGFLYPDTYIIPRQATAEQLVDEFVRNFVLHLTTDIREGFKRQQLTVYQAVTLASIVQREAVIPDEQPQIASVFLNRLAIGMKLESDPTVQYALGYNQVQGTWWTNPLSLSDLDSASLYNTYRNPGLPPGPISSPSLNTLRAVAFPAQTPYYYFRARCDNSGLHNFAETFEGHLNNSCQ
jgi:UPF0755 protein